MQNNAKENNNEDDDPGMAYYFVMTALLLFTAFVYFIRVVILESKLEGAPALASQFYYVTGCLQLLLSFLVLLVFSVPCNCSLLFVWLIPLITACIALRWLYIGHERSIIAKAIQRVESSDLGVGSNDEDGEHDDFIFDTVSTIEVI